MTSIPPVVSYGSFLAASNVQGVGRTSLGEIDPLLIQFDKCKRKHRAAILARLCRACDAWFTIDDQNATIAVASGHHTSRASAVNQLYQDCWRLMQYDQYSKGKKINSKNTKSLADHHQHEADVMNKQAYQNEHAGMNAVGDILKGFGQVGNLSGSDANLVTNYKNNHLRNGNQFKKISEMSIDEYRAFETFIITHNIEPQWRQTYYSKDERVGYLLVPAANNGHEWWIKFDQPFETRGNYQSDQALFVVDRYGNWYASEAQPGVINHSTLCRGQPILCGGMMEVHNGKLISITNNSGHYQPTRKQFRLALLTISNFFDFTTVEVRVEPAASNVSPIFYRSNGVPATHFLNSFNAPGTNYAGNPANYANWPVC